MMEVNNKSRGDGSLPSATIQRATYAGRILPAASEAESIAILREVAAEFSNPVLMYSIGKDSSVLLHLALKAFYPAKPPLPLLHVDTTWKFREMIAFRDETAKRLGLDLIVHINREGLDRGVDPVASGSALHTQVMKTEALKQALDNRLRRGDRREAARRGEKPGEGADLLVP
jgi:3'-phosphoadenosine 5'-phosphosulfate sulfotransferase (PAPS reductase)/FAD synthetase